MIPLKLTIEGIYSYQNRQTIDFEALTQAGLFGIFGATGSGKSSILEAISFVLYGETERLNGRDKRPYNMMNLRSKRSYIEFDFENHEGKRFRIAREFKRNSKRFEDVKPTTTVFYELKGESWVPLDCISAEKILGLSYDNFKRTIIIPQGQFKEFLELGAKDRTEMMKEIFQLQRFDLGDKISGLNKKNQSELDVLEGKLSGFEEVSEEILQALSKQVQEQQVLFEQTEKDFQQKDRQFRRLELLKKDFENLQTREEQFKKLEAQRRAMLQKENELQRFEKLSGIFTEPLQRQRRFTKEQSEVQNELKVQKATLAEIQAKLDKNKQALSDLKPDYAALPEKRILEKDMEWVVKIKTADGEIKKLKERTVKGQQLVDEFLKKMDTVKVETDLLENRQTDLEQHKLKTDLLLKVESWFVQKRNLAENAKKSKAQVKTLEEELQAIESSLKVKDQKILDQQFQKETEELKLEQERLSRKKGELEIQKQLAKYTHELHDGVACPLCGSPDHPHIAEIEDVSEKLANLKAALQTVEEKQKALQNKRIETTGIFQKITLKRESISKAQKDLDMLQKQGMAHTSSFVWKEFDSENEKDFQEKKILNSQTEKEIEILKDSLRQKKKQLAALQQDLEKFNKGLENFKIEEAKKQTEITQYQQNIQRIKVEAFQTQDIDQMKDSIAGLKKENDKIENDFLKFQDALNQQAPLVASKAGNIETSEHRLSQIEDQLKKVELELQEALDKGNIELSELLQVLALNLKVDEVREQISRFKIDFKTLENQVFDLKNRLKDEDYSKEKFATSQDEQKKSADHLKVAQDSLTKVKSENERLTKAFEQKKELIKTQTELQHRSGNLKILLSLFKAAGFVQYVSAIYLRQLCDHANVRFQRMTRNQLSLQVNENNDFEIIDYLNEGRSRSVKTLSGGQAFQVSLSLALALAESVQSNAKAEKNFFFIDEGFGTQDLESVNLVFETLQHLQRENRIVGIISHVEELKEKIPLSLNIVKDEQRGSLIYAD